VTFGELGRLILAWVVILSANAFANRATAKEGFPIVDSRAFIDATSHIYWLDNHRLLFLGHEPVETQTGAAVQPVSLLLWNVGREMEVVRSNVHALCVRSGGYVSYAVRQADGTRVHYQGKLGSESQVEHRGFDLANCDITTPRNDRAENRVRRPLLREHGYLLLGPALGRESMENTPVLYFREGQAGSISMPFGRRELGRVDYYEFRNAYFGKLYYFDPNKKVSYASWPKEMNAKAFWLSPGGVIEVFDLPNDVQYGHPTAVGFVYLIFGTRSSKDGLYLYSAGKRTLVMRGYVTEYVTSPDGCAVAFRHASDENSYLFKPTANRTLKVANFCNQQSAK
jgi:hypothetical protein